MQNCGGAGVYKSPLANPEISTGHHVLRNRV